MARDFVAPVRFQIVGLQDLQKANRIMRDMGAPTGNVARATRGVGRMGNTTQNAAFQIQDFIVQVEGGTDATRALGQQLPQLLGAFGAIGASIGVVVALLPAFARGLFGSAEGAKTLDDQLDDLNTQVETMATIATSQSFTGWVEAFNQLSAAARETQLALLGVRQRQAELNLEAAIDELTSFASVDLVGGMAQLQSMASNLGITVGQLERLRQIYADTNGNVMGDPEALSEFVSILGSSATQAEKYLQRIVEIQAAEESIVAGRETLAAAESAGATGIIPTDEELQNFDEFISGFSGLPTIAQQVEGAMADIESTVDESGGTFDSVFSTLERNWGNVVQGVAQGTQSIDQAIKSMVSSVLAELGKIAAVKLVGELFGGSASAAADGAVMSGGKMTAFAKGGVVSSPTMFPMRNGAGLMGEAGPEAIMPLARNSQGQLGVKAEGMSVTINNMAPGVDIRPTQTDQGLQVDVVIAELTNRVNRGGDPFSGAMETRYNLSRGQGVY